MQNSHCNNNDKKIRNIKEHKKNMQSPRFEPRIYRIKDHRGIHYAMEADEIIDKVINIIILNL